MVPMGSHARDVYPAYAIIIANEREMWKKRTWIRKAKEIALRLKPCTSATPAH